ncbi:MAG: hypothetical protein LC641_03730 [Spirochaeta sp.]|nr:hypothetical protein [Spirochaeta sp.]
MSLLKEYDIDDFVAVYAGDTDIIMEISDIFLEEAPQRLSVGSTNSTRVRFL